MQAPARLGKYLIRRELGRGAMGVVYEGYDPMIERAVAIKVLRIDEGNAELAGELRTRFRREAQAGGRLGHPGIVAVYEYGEDDASGTTFIAMELVRGRDLKSLFDAGTRFTLAEAGRIMEELLDALQHAHERGVVHRDIKPGNIILLEGGGVKVADFGIAKLDTSELTQLGSVLGTVSHMAPEQLTGETVDGRSDLYSSGVILYQLLTGERPFSGPPARLMHQVLHEQPLPPSQRVPSLPPAVDAVVLKAMAKQAAERHADARTFAAALRAALATRPHGAADDETTVLRPQGQARASGASAVRPSDLTTLPSSTAASTPAPAPVGAAAGPAAPTAVLEAGNGNGRRRIVPAVLALAGIAVAGVAGYRLLASHEVGEPTVVAGASQAAPTAPPVPAGSAPAPVAPPAARPVETAAAPQLASTEVSAPMPPALMLPATPGPVPAPAEAPQPAPAAIVPEPARRAPTAPAPAPAALPRGATAAAPAPPASQLAATPAPPPAPVSRAPSRGASLPSSARMAAAPVSPPIASTPTTAPAPRSGRVQPMTIEPGSGGYGAADDRARGGIDATAPPSESVKLPAPRVEARIAPDGAAPAAPQPAIPAPAETRRAASQPSAQAECFESARRGDARCQVVVGNSYRAGRGVARDPVEAARWYRKAAEQGSDVGQYELGVMLENGLGVVRSPLEAVAWYRKAGAAGYARAQNALGRAYENGLTAPPNLVLAADWYRKAADQNLPIAQYNLGRMYLFGRGVFKNASTGHALLQKAADAGEPNAMVYVAEMYLNGDGKPRDREQAVRLYREALGRGGLNDRNRATAERALASAR